MITSQNQTTKKTTLNFFSPYKAQKQIVRACINPNIKYVVYNAARQSGKTLLLSNMAVYYALETMDQHVMVVSPTDSQVKKIYKQILNSIIHLPFIKSYKIQAGDSEILFKNGSVIVFRSAASTNTLRGYSNTHVLLDEAAFINEEVWNTILAPTLLVRGKKAIFCSTPKGTNFFYKLYMEGKRNEKYASFKTTYKDNPFADKEFIEGQRKTLPTDIFRQEYEGEFIDSAGLFQNIEKFATLKELAFPQMGDTYFAGIDIGFKKDSTVIVIFNQRGEMVKLVKFNQTNNTAIIENIKKALTEFNVLKAYVEANNQGLPIIEQLITAGLWMIEAFNTTATSKPQIINNLIYATNSSEVLFLNNEELISEFKAFGYSISKTGHVKFEANYGHDDIVMATAIAYWCMKQNLYTGILVFN